MVKLSINRINEIRGVALRTLLLLSCLFMNAFVKSQNISFRPFLNGLDLVPNTAVFVPSLNDSIRIEDLRFYISEAQFITASGKPLAFSRHHYLCDFQQPASLQIAAPALREKNGGDALFFQIGIDSTTNSAGALGQDLDPVNGMYWSWNSGYINVKIQGTSAACPARNHQFEFHLGGYLFPNNALCTFQQPFPFSSKIEIGIELNGFFEVIDLKKEFQIMSPSKRAVELSKVFAGCFYVMP